MSILNKYRNYDTSFVEVVFQRLREIYDIKLKNNQFKYAKLSDYQTDYLKYIAPGSANVNKLTSIFDTFDESRYLLTYLPYNIEVLEPSSENQAFEEMIEGFDSDVKEELISKKNIIENQMGSHNSYNDYPLLINDNSNLKEFLLSTEEEIIHYFFGSILLFPTHLDWLMHFDYDLGAIHFIHKKGIFEKFKMRKELGELKYTHAEINQLIIETDE